MHVSTYIPAADSTYTIVGLVPRQAPNIVLTL